MSNCFSYYNGNDFLLINFFIFSEIQQIFHNNCIIIEEYFHIYFSSRMVSVILALSYFLYLPFSSSFFLPFFLHLSRSLSTYPSLAPLALSTCLPLSLTRPLPNSLPLFPPFIPISSSILIH